MNITQAQARLILEMAQTCQGEGGLSNEELTFAREILRAFPALRELRGDDHLFEYVSLFEASDEQSDSSRTA